MMKIFFVLALLRALTCADVVQIIEGQTTIVVNTKISNIDEYPDTKFVVCRYGMKNSSYPFGIIDCQELNSSTKMNGFVHHFTARLLYAIPKTLYGSIDIIAALKNYTPVNGLNDKIFQRACSLTTDESIDDKYKIDEETRVYKITSVSYNNVTLKLEKRIIHFSNGDDNKTINY